MIASNFGFLEIVKTLYDAGASLNVVDAYNFTPLLYSIKMKHHALMLWLLCRGADTKNLCDNNGCSSVHWAAYENDMFTLYFLKAVGVEINLLDKQGFTPLARSCHNYAYGSVRFLCENYPDMVMYGALPGTSKSLLSYIRVIKYSRYVRDKSRNIKHQKIHCSCELKIYVTNIIKFCFQSFTYYLLP